MILRYTKFFKTSGLCHSTESEADTGVLSKITMNSTGREFNQSHLVSFYQSYRGCLLRESNTADAQAFEKHVLHCKTMTRAIFMT